MLAYIILGFLHHQEMTGYDIKQALSMSTSNFYDASFGSIYPMLKKMQGDGWITSRETVESGKFRVIYAITDAGRAAFEHWLYEPIELQPSRLHFLVRLFFYDMLPQDQARSLIQHFIEEIEREQRRLMALDQRLEGRISFFPKQTLEFGKEYYDFLAQWLGHLQEQLDSKNDHKEV